MTADFRQQPSFFYRRHTDAIDIRSWRDTVMPAFEVMPASRQRSHDEAFGDRAGLYLTHGHSFASEMTSDIIKTNIEVVVIVVII